MIFVKNKKKFSKIKLYMWLAVLLFVFACVQYNRIVLPAAVEVSQKYTTTEVNKRICDAIDDVIEGRNIKSGDFISSRTGSDGKISAIDIDSILINSICAEAAYKISASLNEMEDKNIQLPLGTFTGVNLITNLGPMCHIRITSMGDALVDYETKFEAVGINQINYQVWLVVQTDEEIVNPLFSKQLKITRRLMLVNSVFNGDVPNTYLNGRNMVYGE
jgi:sporulation protein YunB